MADARAIRQIERGLWPITALILLGSYYLVTAHYGGRIAAASSRAQALYGQTLSNRRLLTNRGRILALRAELRQRLMGVAVTNSPPHVTAQLVADLDRTSRANGCTLVSILPAPAVRKRAFEELPVEVVVRGKFRELLRVVSSLPRAHTLLRVNSVTFALTGGQERPQHGPLLDAKIHSTVYRLNAKQYRGEL